jgi:hypothetical protein
VALAWVVGAARPLADAYWVVVLGTGLVAIGQWLLLVRGRWAQAAAAP